VKEETNEHVEEAREYKNNSLSNSLSKTKFT